MAANSRFAVATHVILAVAAFEREAPDHWVSSETIASSVNTNPVVIRRVLGDLKRAGLVDSMTGKLGGNRLSRKPEKISLSDVWEAIGDEDSFAMNPNVPVDQCPVSRSMQRILDPIFSKAQQAMRKELSKVHLADLLKKIA